MEDRVKVVNQGGEVRTVAKLDARQYQHIHEVIADATQHARANNQSTDPADVCRSEHVAKIISGNRHLERELVGVMAVYSTTFESPDRSNKSLTGSKAVVIKPIR